MKDRLLLLTATFFWGCAFVAQKVSTGSMGAFSFNAVRFLIGFIGLYPVAWWLNRRPVSFTEKPPHWLTQTVACAILGFILFGGASLQQLGLFYTTAGKAGFITALYIIVVPLMGLFLYNPLRLNHVIGCFLALTGLYFLAYHSDGSPFNMGDLLVLVGVVFWTLHILVIDRFVHYYRGVNLALGQFLFCSLYNFIALFLAGENLTLNGILAAAIPLLYCGLLSSSVAYTLQIVGQEHVPPTEASLLLSTEMIWSALAGFVLLDESMTSREFLGCLLMSAGIYLAQIPSRILFKSKEKR